MTMQVTLCVVIKWKIMLYVNAPAENLDVDRSLNLMHGNLYHVFTFIRSFASVQTPGSDVSTVTVVTYVSCTST